MNREDFISNFLLSEGAYVIPDFIGEIDVTCKVMMSLIGSIYDLQQQIAQKDEFIDYLDNRLINIEQEVYK